MELVKRLKPVEKSCKVFILVASLQHVFRRVLNFRAFPASRTRKTVSSASETAKGDFPKAISVHRGDGVGDGS